MPSVPTLRAVHVDRLNGDRANRARMRRRSRMGRPIFGQAGYRLCLDYASLLAFIWYGWSTDPRTGRRRARLDWGFWVFGDLMAFDAAIAEGLLSRRRMGRSETVVLVSAAVALAIGAAAWISSSDQA